MGPYEAEMYKMGPNQTSVYKVGPYEAELFSMVLPNDNKTSPVWSIVTLACSSVGMILSAGALGLLILTATFFNEWRRSYKNQLLIQFMLARFFYTSVRFINDIRNVIDGCYRTECLIYLHIPLMMYSEIALVAWMFVFTRQMYISLVKVFDSEQCNIWKVSVTAWIAPGIVSLLLHMLYYVQTDNDSKYFVIYLLIIKWPVLIANAILLISILRSILRNNSKTESNMRIILVMILLIFMFGFQQILVDICKIVYVKFVDSYSTVFTLLITSNILTMYHCAFSILFWVFGNANTRKLWRFQELRDKIQLRIWFKA